MVDYGKYNQPDWAVGMVVRASGLMEDTCKHGVGHPNMEFLTDNPGYRERGFSVHGCDGCCSKEVLDEIKRDSGDEPEREKR